MEPTGVVPTMQRLAPLSTSEQSPNPDSFGITATSMKLNENLKSAF